MAKVFKTKTEWTFKDIAKLGDDMLDWLDADKEHNFLLGKFFAEQHVFPEWVESWTVNDRVNKYPASFRNQYKIALQIQMYRLAEMATKKEFAGSGVIQLLKNLCEWSTEDPLVETRIDVTPENLARIKTKFYRKMAKKQEADAKETEVELVEKLEEYNPTYEERMAESKRLIAES